MIKFLLISIVMTLGFTSAQQNWVESIINPTPEARAAVCKDVYDRTSTNTYQEHELQNFFAQSGGSGAGFFRSTLGAVSSMCNWAARRLDNIPNSRDLKLSTFSFVVLGSIGDLKRARDWVAVFVLYKQDGSEITRLRFDPRFSRLGDTGYWKADCSGASCRWEGRNIYYFELSEELLGRLKEATSFGFLFTNQDWKIGTAKFAQQEFLNLK